MIPLMGIILVSAASMAAFAATSVAGFASGSCLWNGERFSHVENVEFYLRHRESGDHPRGRWETHTVSEFEVYRSARPNRSSEPYPDWMRLDVYGCVVSDTDMQEAIPAKVGMEIHHQGVATTPRGQMVQMAGLYDDHHWHITSFGFFPIEAIWHQAWTVWVLAPPVATSLSNSMPSGYGSARLRYTPAACWDAVA